VPDGHTTSRSGTSSRAVLTSFCTLPHACCKFSPPPSPAALHCPGSLICIACVLPNWQLSDSLVPQSCFTHSTIACRTCRKLPSHQRAPALLFFYFSRFSPETGVVSVQAHINRDRSITTNGGKQHYLDNCVRRGGGVTWVNPSRCAWGRSTSRAS